MKTGLKLAVPPKKQKEIEVPELDEVFRTHFYQMTETFLVSYSTVSFAEFNVDKGDLVLIDVKAKPKPLDVIGVKIGDKTALTVHRPKIHLVGSEPENKHEIIGVLKYVIKPVVRTNEA
jgi:hypothetical protein